VPLADQLAQPFDRVVVTLGHFHDVRLGGVLAHGIANWLMATNTATACLASASSTRDSSSWTFALRSHRWARA
jgi:hypothetical protein